LRAIVIIVAVQASWVRDSYYYAFGVAVFGAVTSLYVARFAYWAVERHFIGKGKPAGVPIRTTASGPDGQVAAAIDDDVFHAIRDAVARR
jgi:hypothetical protein